ncbi:hypothetical protein D1823_06940 [Ruegeria sp. AD91A]|nr:hypothetical protein D1823_06940 [Ruegeria sp. AD91A]
MIVQQKPDIDLQVNLDAEWSENRAAPAIWFEFPEQYNRNALNLSCSDPSLFHARSTEKTGAITKGIQKPAGV